MPGLVTPLEQGWGVDVRVGVVLIVRYLKQRPGVNFTNILRAAFHKKVFCATFMCLQFGFVIFGQEDFDAKATHKTLVKLTPGPNVYITFYSRNL